MEIIDLARARNRCGEGTRQLRSCGGLGWAETTRTSGANHTVWVRRGRRLAVPTYDLIYDSTAERLLDEAEEKTRMMVTARVFPEASGFSAHCEPFGVYTQGPTRAQAMANLAEAIVLQIGHDGLSVDVDDLDGEMVRVTANDPSLLASEMLKHQRLLDARKTRSAV